MNIFKVVLINVVLIMFPILCYLIFLSTNKNIDKINKKIYYFFTLLTSLFLINYYNINNNGFIILIIVSTLVLLAYLKDEYIIGVIMSILIIILYNVYYSHMNIFLIGYIALFFISLLMSKINKIVYIELFVITNIIIYFIWSSLYDLNINYVIIISYILISNIVCLINLTSIKIFNTYIEFKELQQEKQIRLSLFKITHEIKNPIAVCKCYLDMINTSDKDQVERYIPILKSEIERLLTLLQDFLLINKSNLDFDIMDINMLIQDNLDKLKPLLEENNIKYNMNLIDDEIYINGDYNRLSQVILNVLKNSIESISNSGHIKINTKIKNNKYYITIEDSGCGMTKEVLKKFKEPFYTTKNRGSGLGVSLIYEIIEAHNGKVIYDSKEGVGTKVKIELPLTN